MSLQRVVMYMHLKIVDDVVKTDEFSCFCMSDNITTGISKYYEPVRCRSTENDGYMIRIKNTSLTCNLVKGNYYRVGIIFETYGYPLLQKYDKYIIP